MMILKVAVESSSACLRSASWSPPSSVAFGSESSVSKRDVGLGKGEYPMVEGVLVAVELDREGIARPSHRLVQRAHVAAGAKGAPAGALDHDRADAPVRRPFDEPGVEPARHLEGQRVERLGAVERHPPDRPRDLEQNVVVAAHPPPSVRATRGR